MEVMEMAKRNKIENVVEVSAMQSSLRYDLIRNSTYALGIEELRSLGKEPLSFKANMQARLEQPEFYDTWLDSRVGVASKTNSNKFKLILNCKQLKNISPPFNDLSMEVDYSKLKGRIFDLDKIKHGQRLTKEEVLEDPVWLELVEGDKAFLKEYVDFTIAQYKLKDESDLSSFSNLRPFNDITHLMEVGFYSSSFKRDRLVTLTLGSLLECSYAHMADLYNNGCRFLYEK